MTAPIGLQLYSIRDEMNRDFEGSIRKVADIGYVGVEPAGFPGTSPEKAASLFQSLGLKVPCAHVPAPVGNAKQQTLDTMSALGSRRIVSGLGPNGFKTVDRIKKSCDVFNEACQVAAENGMSFAVHNHWWEFLKVDGKYAYRIMLDRLMPEVLFELDTYWVKVAGVDPATVLAELGDRAPLLHIKDGPGNKEAAMQAIGDGSMDVPGIVEAGGTNTEWLIVELDRCDTDMMAALEKSYAYLTSRGLAEGND